MKICEIVKSTKCPRSPNIHAGVQMKKFRYITKIMTHKAFTNAYYTYKTQMMLEEVSEVRFGQVIKRYTGTSTLSGKDKDFVS